MNMRKSLFVVMSGLLISSSGLSACSANDPNTTSANSLKSAEKVINIGNGQKGATISFKINVGDANGFKTKATSANGIAPKTSADIDYYQVYLIKSAATTNYAGTDNDKDPLGDVVTGYGNGFTIAKTFSQVTFTDVPGSGTDYYYVAVRALDNNNTAEDNTDDIDIIDVNNHNQATWAGTTASGTGTMASGAGGRIAVSTGAGVNVNSDYQITNTGMIGVFLPVTVNLADAVGATIGSALTIVPGTSPSPSSITVN